MDGLDGSVDPAGETSDTGWKFTVSEEFHLTLHKKKILSKYHLSVVKITVIYQYNDKMCRGPTTSVQGPQKKL